MKNSSRGRSLHLVEVIDENQRRLFGLRLNNIGDVVDRLGQLAHPPFDDLAQFLACAGLELDPGCQAGKEHVQPAVHIHRGHLARPDNLLGHLPAPMIQLTLERIRDAPAAGLELAIHPSANGQQNIAVIQVIDVGFIANAKQDGEVFGPNLGV